MILFDYDKYKDYNAKYNLEKKIIIGEEHPHMYFKYEVLYISRMKQF